MVLNICNVKDFKENGEWVFYKEQNGVKTITRSGVVWMNIHKRLRQDKSYERASCLFHDFNRFSEWCQSQYGYLLQEDNGKFWSLDKDILREGNKVYSEDTCIFVPQIVNNLFETSEATKGTYCLGAYLSKNGEKFTSRCRDPFLKKVLYLGTHKTELEAHRAWQQCKIGIMRKLANVYKEHGKLEKALIYRSDLLEYEYENNLITTFGRAVL